jgi:hypothetical protein
MYFLVGGLMFLSAICLLGIPETGKKALSDIVDKNTNADTNLKNNKKLENKVI